MRRIHGNADGGTGKDFVVADPERRIQRAQRFLRRQERYGGTFDGRKNAGKTVAAHLADQITRAQYIGTQQLRDAVTHRIANVVAPCRIDAADQAAVDEQHGQISAVNPSFLDLAAQCVQKRDCFGGRARGGRRLSGGGIPAHRNISRGSILTEPYSRERWIR